MTFDELDQLLDRYSPAFRCEVEAHMADDVTAGAWRLVQAEATSAVEEAVCPDPILDYEPPARKPRHDRGGQRAGRARDRAPLRSVTDRDDPLRELPLDYAIEVLTGLDVPRCGMVSCPAPDHEDRTPSCKITGDFWNCFGCGRGGTIYDLAAELWGYPSGTALRGDTFLEVRQRLLATFAHEAAA